MPWGSLPCRPGPCSCSPSCSLRRQLPRPVPSRDRRRRPGGTDARSHGGGASGAAPLPGASTRGSSEGAPGPRGAGTEAAGGAEAPPAGRGAGAGSAAPAQPAGGVGTSRPTRAAEAVGTDVGWTSGGAALPARHPELDRRDERGVGGYLVLCQGIFNIFLVRAFSTFLVLFTVHDRNREEREKRQGLRGEGKAARRGKSDRDREEREKRRGEGKAAGTERRGKSGEEREAGQTGQTGMADPPTTASWPQ